MNQRFEIDGESPSPPPKRKQRLLHGDDDRRRRRIGEVAGGATAECAVMCCCIPVAIINLLVLAVYKVPAGLGKKVWRRKNKKKRLLKMNIKRSENFADNFGEIFGAGRVGAGFGWDRSDGFEDCEDVSGFDFEDELMWDELHGTGFWRVPSVKEVKKQQDIVVELDSKF